MKKLAFEFANKLGVPYPTTWNDKNMAGRFWFNGFLKRHPAMSMRKPQQISQARVRGFNRERVGLFFDNLERAIDPEKGGYHFEAKSIWNMDETGYSIVPTRVGEVCAQKGSRNVGLMSSAEKGATVTMVTCVSASGTYCPPFWIFPFVNMQRIFLEHAPEGSVGMANSSGWIHENEFVEFMKHFIKYTSASVGNPQLLVLDNHVTHLSVKAIDLAVEYGITMVSLPPHCSHKLQPLDVAVFKPFKSYYSTACTNWLKQHIPNPIEVRHIPEIVATMIDLALTSSNIKSGFRATGNLIIFHSFLANFLLFFPLFRFL